MNYVYKLSRLAIITALLIGMSSCMQTEEARHEEPEKRREQTQQGTAARTITTAQNPTNNPVLPKLQPTKPTNNPAKTQSTKPGAKPVKSDPFTVKKCMNLGNALESPREGDWGYRIRNRDFSALKTAGFDTVRIPIRWDTHTSHRAPYTIDPAFMSRIQTVVNQALAHNLNVIIDVHHFESLMDHTDREQERFIAIWSQITNQFKDSPSQVIFEILNEPTLSISTGRLNEIYARLIPVIRKTNPSRKLIIGGNSWNSVERLSHVRWPKDTNIVATYHDYGPHEFTHQGAKWMDPPMPFGRKWGNAADRAELADTLAKAHSFKIRTGRPLFVGEFGVIDTVDQAQRNLWIKTRRKAMEQAGISWCAWDFVGAFSLYDQKRNQWKPGVLDALFGP